MKATLIMVLVVLGSKGLNEPMLREGKNSGA